MKTPPKLGLKAGFKASALYAIVAGAAIVLWEWVGRLAEHVVLGWIADHLKELPIVLTVASWTLASPVEVFLGAALLYCVFVMARAFAVREAVSPIAVAVPQSPQQALRPTTVKQPHFECVGPAIAPLYISYHPTEGVRPPASRSQEEEAGRAVTLRFTNLPKPDGSSKRAMNVVARMRFYSEDWTHFADVDYGVWVGGPCETTDFDVGDVRQLVLFFFGAENSYFTLTDMRHSGHFEFSEHICYVRDLRVDWIANVEVILIDQQSHVSANWVLHVTPHGNSCDNYAIVPPASAARLPR